MEVFNDVQKQSFHIFYQIGVLKKFLKLTGKHLWCHLFDNVVTLQAATLLNKRLRHKCFFRLKFWIIWKNTSYQKVSGWLALNLVHVMRSPNFMNTCPSVIYKKKKKKLSLKYFDKTSKWGLVSEYLFNKAAHLQSPT